MLPTMKFYASVQPDGTVHVQNAVAGLLGQHHVHTAAGFDAWKRDGDDVVMLKGTRPCECGLVPGEKRSGR